MQFAAFFLHQTLSPDFDSELTDTLFKYLFHNI